MKEENNKSRLMGVLFAAMFIILLAALYYAYKMKSSNSQDHVETELVQVEDTINSESEQVFLDGEDGGNGDGYSDYQESTKDNPVFYVGIIEDKDGYVNVRKETSAKSEIVGTISTGDDIVYAEDTNSNWYRVCGFHEGVTYYLGYVHKSRVRRVGIYEP